jgi:hypothetical protein
MHPDFVFFSRVSNGSIVADIVDPHGTHFSDALPKLRALARYAEERVGDYRRIESIAKVGDNLRVLDLTDGNTRSAIESAEDANELFAGSCGGTY